jgi:hypothetical protein
MKKTFAFLKRHGLPERLSEILGRPFIFVFAEGGEEWSGVVTGVRIDHQFKGFMIDTSGWNTEYGNSFVIEEVEVDDLPSGVDSSDSTVFLLRKPKTRRLQLADANNGYYYPGHFMFTD